MNPRYLAYAKAHGKTPAGMLASDTERWPGGKMAGFILWVGARWAEWCAARGLARYCPKGPRAHQTGTGGPDFPY